MTFSLFSCDNQESKLIDFGISHELATNRKVLISDLNYNLFFDIPKNKDQPIHANIEISFLLSKTTDDLILDYNGNPENISKISVNGTEISVVYKKQHLIIDNEVLKKQNLISFEMLAGDQSLNRHSDYLYTLFVPARASTCFPLFDQPDLKAKYSLKLNVPKSWEAVSNGKIKNVTHNEQVKTIDFETTKLISSYLFAFTAGQFKKVTKILDGKSLTMYHRETDSLKVRNNVDTIFDWHMRAKNWLEEYTQITNPFDRMDFVLLPSFQYGGMEHPNVIYYKSSSLLLSQSATLNDQLRRSKLIAHEVSHMWFGNLVTMKWFDDVWLKEVFANFYAAKIANPHYPNLDHELKFLLSHYPEAYKVDRTKGTHPIKQKLDNLNKAGTLYGNIIYDKAPIVMKMLEDNIGADTLQFAIQKYLKKYEYSNASWNDLLEIINEHSNYNLNQWNRTWVISEGMPSVYANIRKKKNKISRMSLYTQTKGDDNNQTWKQNLTILMGEEDSAYQVNTQIGSNIDSLKGNIFPKYFFTNASGLGYGYFRMGPYSKTHFLDSVNNYNPMLRAALWLNYYEFMLRNELDPIKLIEAIILNLPKEQNELINAYLLETIEIIFWRFLSDEERDNIAPKLEGLLLNMAIGANDEQIKSSYFKTLRTVFITNSSIDLFNRIWNKEIDLGGLELSETDYIKIAQELAIRSPIDSNILVAQSDSIKNIDTKEKFNFVMPSLSSNSKIRDQFFESLKNENNRTSEEWVLEGLYYLNHPLRAKESIKYIKPSLRLLEEIQSTGDIFFPKRWLDNLLWGHSSDETDVIVHQFLYSNHAYPNDLKNKILQSSDLLFRAVTIRENKLLEDENMNKK